MALVTMRLVKRITNDGLVEVEDHVPVGQTYVVRSETVRNCRLRHVSGRWHQKLLVWTREDRWLAMELLEPVGD